MKLLFHLIFFLYSVCANESMIINVCPLKNNADKNLVTYRYQFICDTVLCPINQGLNLDLYSTPIILLHNRNWSLIKNVTNYLSRCTIKYILVDFIEPTINLNSICAYNQTVLIFSLTADTIWSTQMRVDFNETCSKLTLREDNKLFNYIMSTCMNTVWIMGSVDCSNMTSYVNKIFYSKNDRFADKTLLYGKNLRLGMIINPPYFFKSTVSGEQVYQGILYNLLEKMAANLHFNYSICFPNDMKYGGLNDDNKTWNGMIGDLLLNVTDVVFADLTVTYQRSSVIDFTLPYLNEPIGIIIRQPELDNNLWKMFSLFSNDVWLAIICSIILSSITLCILHKFSALPIDSPFNNIGQCIWSIGACFSNQGCEYDPETWSVQNFMALFWLYVFAVLSAYSGGLIAVLSANRIALPFKDLEGLSLSVQQNKFKVCLAAGTALHGEIMTGAGFYGNLRDFLIKHPTYLTTRENCQQKLKDENNVAFVEEITIIEKIQADECKLYKFIILNERFFPGNFAVGLPKNSSLNEIFSQQLTMAVDGDLIQGWKKNFSKDSMSFCTITKPDAVVTADSNDLSLKEFAGPFILFIIGIVVSIFVFIYEQHQICCKRKQQRNVISPENSNREHRYTTNSWIRYSIDIVNRNRNRI